MSGRLLLIGLVMDARESEKGKGWKQEHAVLPQLPPEADDGCSAESTPAGRLETLGKRHLALRVTVSES